MNNEYGLTSGCIAVIFTNTRSRADEEGYERMAVSMVELAKQQDGYLGMSSVRNPTTREGITVSYWRDYSSAQAFKQVSEHLAAQQRGREVWYENYSTVIAVVDHAYEYTSGIT